MSGHGWVTPNHDGSKARCGGPAICSACAREKAVAEAAIAARLTEASSSGQQTAAAPAETMRRAAALMRERAEGCEPRRWHWQALGEKRYPQRVSSDGNVALIAETYIDPAHRPYEAEHIASWHPLVALAVAEWLERDAALADAQVFPRSDPAMERYPLRVARAYLGEGES